MLIQFCSVPLIGRMRLGYEVGNAGGDFGIASLDLFANPRDRLGHVDDTVQVDRPFAR